MQIEKISAVERNDTGTVSGKSGRSKGNNYAIGKGAV